MADPRHALGFAYGAHTTAPTGRLRDHMLALLDLDADGIDGFHPHAWGEEPHIAGGYPAFAPGQLIRHGPALRTRHHRLHFAGADRSIWPGTMEGAVRDGNRVAADILTRLA